jgi:hypothetical protein
MTKAAIPPGKMLPKAAVSSQQERLREFFFAVSTERGRSVQLIASGRSYVGAGSSFEVIIAWSWTRSRKPQLNALSLQNQIVILAGSLLSLIPPL